MYTAELRSGNLLYRTFTSPLQQPQPIPPSPLSQHTYPPIIPFTYICSRVYDINVYMCVYNKRPRALAVEPLLLVNTGALLNPSKSFGLHGTRTEYNTGTFEDGIDKLGSLLQHPRGKDSQDEP